MQRQARLSVKVLALTVVNAMASVGCVLPPAAQAPPAPPPAPSKYYVASVDTESESAAVVEQGLEILDDRATQALRPGIKVAFFPPDQCRNIAASSTAATPEQVEMANDCGVLISALETSVADRYSVVSWQTLKGEDPFARAEARKVDIIFEVDSFGMSELGKDASSLTGMHFYEQSNPSDRTPLVVSPEEYPTVTRNCEAGVRAMQTNQAKAGFVDSFTGAIKAVEVSSGQALAYYQRTVTDDPGQETQDGFDLYFESRGQQEYTPPPPVPRKYNGMQKGGAGLLAFGALMTAPGIALTVVSLEKPNFTGPAIGTLVPGATMLIVGAVLLVLGNKKARESVSAAGPGTLGPVVYPTPGQVLCMQPPTTPPWMATPGWEGPVEAPQGGSSYTFSDSETAQRDAARARENRLRKLVITDFTAELGKLGN